MKIGGWKTRSVFERYAIVNQSDIADGMTKLQEQQQRDIQQQKDQEKQFGQSLGRFQDKRATESESHSDTVARPN